jgi:hypothetical protein
MCAVDDCEPWVVHRESRPVARKTYGCYECGRSIAVGERYHKIVGLSQWGQDQTPMNWDTVRTCRHCDSASEWMSVVCGGYPLGALWQELHEHWVDGYRSVAFARLIVGVRRRWHDGRDPVPAGVSELANEMLRKAVA